MNLSKGDRVVHNIYGEGTFIRYSEYTCEIAFVRFDKTPPCYPDVNVLFADDLEKVDVKP